MKNTISALNLNKALLSPNILEKIPGNFIVFDASDHNIIYIKFLPDGLLGYSNSEIQTHQADLIKQLLHPDDKIVVDQFIEELKELPVDAVRQSEIRFKDKYGKYYSFEINLSAFSRDDKNQVTEIIGLFWNINNYKTNNNSLEDSELSYRKIFNTIEDAIYIQDESGAFVDLNNGAINMYGYSREEIIGKTPEFLSAEGKNDFKLLNENLAKALNGIPQNFEFWGRRKNGETFIKDVKVYNSIYFGENVLIAHARDITKRKMTEEKFRTALTEKNALLREVHHRVKNNLQAMIYLIEMQIEKLEDQKIQNFLRELQEQARTMSLVYEQLYQSDYLAEVDMDGYLNNLTSNVIQAFGAGKSINFKVDAENALLDVEIAMPCGLILNELLTNSLKYAFAENSTEQPMINISLKKENQEIEIIVSDNGIGLPENFDWENTESLGLKLVNFWVKYQLAGSINLNLERGTKYIIKFSYEDKR